MLNLLKTNIMKTRSAFLTLLIASLLCFGCSSQAQKSTSQNQNKNHMDTTNLKNPYYSRTDTTVLNVSDEEWKKVLPEDVYYIARNKGTERAFTGKYWDFEGNGTYYCACCGNALFKSDAKFGSSCGWPSFYESIRPNSVVYHEDNSYGMSRVEVLCGRCNGHLGHIFDDGPAPTYKRFCMNSLVLDFEPDTK
jgi:peptide-methionine (R)-S-oxide reductase